MPSPDRLDDALARGRAGEISLNEVLAELAGTDLYLPIDDSTSFRRQETGDGRSFVPAFSTLDGLRHAEPEVPYLVAAGRDLAPGWEADLWMYVNPEGKTPLMLRSDKVALLAAQPDAEDRPAADSAPDSPDISNVMVNVQSPRIPLPDTVVAMVRDVTLTRPEVAEAYLFEAQDGARGLRLVAGLVPAADSSVRELRDAVTAVRTQLPDDLEVEVMAIDQGLRDVVASSVQPID
ncbi:MAG TPA: SseB family protein [Mycobacteriales bacterium]|jgi:hypothetical protein|nr:SseB family protein [Mycobacteriales bacterium]